MDGDIRPPGFALVLGTGVHRSVEKDLTQKIQTGGLLPDESIKDISRDAVIEEIERSGLELDAEEKERGLPAVRGEIIDQAVTLSGLHHRKLAPIIKPTAVERAFCLELEGFPYDIHGYIDIMDNDLGIAPVVRDTKTAARSPSQGDLDDGRYADQMTIYATAVKVLDGKYPASLKVDALVKTKVPKVTTLSTNREDRDWEIFFRRMELMAKAIERGIFAPASEGAWCCAPKYCGYWVDCPYARQLRTI